MSGQPRPDLVLGYHASHEQLPPSELLACVVAAEAAGFQAAMCSDHFAPWSSRQGHSGFAWSWLGAALQATGLGFGVVNAPGQRYHPAIVAQAAATLSEMFPGRFWLALGSGEASNEHITGDRWPAKAERRARLGEAVAVIRALLAGETVSHDGLVRVDQARLWTLPEQFEVAARFVTPEDVRSAVLVSADLGRHAAWLGEYAELGFERLYLHEVGQAAHQRPFIDAFGSKVIPALTSRGAVGPAGE